MVTDIVSLCRSSMRWVAFWLNCGSMFLNHLFIYIYMIFTYNDVVILFFLIFFIHTHIEYSWTTSRLQGLGALFSRSVFGMAWSKAVVDCPLSFFGGIPVCSINVFLGERNSHISGPMMQEVRNVLICLIQFWEFEGCWHDFKQGSVVDELLEVNSTCF